MAKKKRYVVWGELILDRKTGDHFIRNVHKKKVWSPITAIKYKRTRRTTTPKMSDYV